MDNFAYQQEENSKVYAITRYPSVKRAPNDYFVEVNSRSKLFKKPKFYKILSGCLCLAILVLSLLICLILILYFSSWNDSTQLCTSEECLRTAANLRLSLDLSTDPCHDFYQYTCGRWSEEHPNHGWFAAFSSFSTINEKNLIATEKFLKSTENGKEPFPLKQARDFYKSCMDVETIDNMGFSVLYKYLAEAQLPQIPSLFTKSEAEIMDFQFDWLKMDATIKKLFSMDVFIGFAVDSNNFNKSENVMYIGVPGNYCPLPSPLKEEDFDQEIRKEASAKLISYILNVIIKNTTGRVADEEKIQLASDVLVNMTSFLTDLTINYTVYNGYGKPNSIKDYQRKTNEYLTNEIDMDYPEIWEKYLGYLFEDINVTINFDIEDLYIMDAEADYLPKVVSYILTTSDIYLELYMWWITVYAMIVNTSLDVADDIFKLTASIYPENPIIRSRSLDCSSLVNSFMGMAIGYGLADRAFFNKTKPKVEQMLDDIKEAFVEQVNSISWMDKDTKKATLEKCQEMISFIGYPEWLFHEGALEVYYEGITIQNDSYLENMMSVVKQYMPSQFSQLRVLNERNWSTDPLTVNAFNSFPDNAINVPMGILRFPVYNLGLEVLNYGAIGSVLGHELTHGFDNTGRKHDKFGNYKQWWTNKTAETFEAKLDCFVKQYDNFTINNKHVQGQKTLGENLADNGGLNHAYRAYRNYLKKHGLELFLPGFENFTHDQLFFIAFGSIWCETISEDDLEDQLDYDEHSPNKLRVIGTLQNSVDFSRAFKCPLGSQMNPRREKCKVW